MLKIEAQSKLDIGEVDKYENRALKIVKDEGWKAIRFFGRSDEMEISLYIDLINPKETVARVRLAVAQR